MGHRDIEIYIASKLPNLCQSLRCKRGFLYDVALSAEFQGLTACHLIIFTIAFTLSKSAIHSFKGNCKTSQGLQRITVAERLASRTR